MLGNNLKIMKDNPRLKSRATLNYEWSETAEMKMPLPAQTTRNYEMSDNEELKCMCLFKALPGGLLATDGSQNCGLNYCIRLVRKNLS